MDALLELDKFLNPTVRFPLQSYAARWQHVYLNSVLVIIKAKEKSKQRVENVKGIAVFNVCFHWFDKGHILSY